MQQQPRLMFVDLITMTETLRLLQRVDSGVNYGKKGFITLIPVGNFIKTVFGITYTPSDITSVETEGNMLKASKITAKKFY